MKKFKYLLVVVLIIIANIYIIYNRDIYVKADVTTDILSPVNPANPASPLNPANQMEDQQNVESVGSDLDNSISPILIIAFTMSIILIIVIAIWIMKS